MNFSYFSRIFLFLFSSLIFDGISLDASIPDAAPSFLSSILLKEHWVVVETSYKSNFPDTVSKARFYDSKIKRFITKDPIGLDGGFNLYAYASGNPVFFFDPTGLSPEHGSGFGAGLQTAGEIGASFIPGVGEGLDIAIIIDPNSSILAKTLAAASLGVSVFTAGGSPNAGAFIRGADRLGDVSGSIKNVSGSIDDVANVARTQQHRVDTLSTHAQQRMATRGVSFDSVQEAVSRGTRNFNAQTGVATYYLPASVSSTGRAVRVVRNEATGNIITVIDKGSR